MGTGSNFVQSASFIFLVYNCYMFTSVAALQLDSCPHLELASPKLDDAESLHYEFWQLTLIVITAFCCIFGLWISGAAKVLCLVVSFCQGFARGRWKKAGIRASKRNWVVSKTSNGNFNVCGDNSDFMQLPNGNVAEKPEHQLLVTQPGASIMEQLVPEITQHMLSYLDYRSLCNVSMTNSCMQRAANDDSAWKALFQKASRGKYVGGDSWTQPRVGPLWVCLNRLKAESMARSAHCSFHLRIFVSVVPDVWRHYEYGLGG